MNTDVEVKIDKWVDKEGWGEGPWMEEPDRASWTDPDTGLPCIVRRGNSGAWCGYVGVPPTHPYYGHSYWTDDNSHPDVEVHGGLTFSEPCNDEDRERGVCHVADWEAWWFGFDCAHGGDLMPGIEARLREAEERLKLEGREFPKSPALDEYKLMYPDHYWTMGQVMMETHYLAQQLAKFSGGNK